MFISQRLIVVRAAEGLECLIIPLGNHFAFVNNFLAFLDESLCRRERGKEFFSHLVGKEGVAVEILRAVIAKAAEGCFGGIYLG